MSRAQTLTVAFTLAAAALSAPWVAPASSSGISETNAAIGRALAGSWLSKFDVRDANGNVIPGLDFPLAITLGAAGSVVSTDATDFGGHPVFAGLDGAAHGTWSVRNGVVRFRSVFHEYDAAGVLTGFIRVTATAAPFNFQQPTISGGTWSAEVFAANEDPLGPPRAPAAGGAYTTRKIVAP